MVTLLLVKDLDSYVKGWKLYRQNKVKIYSIVLWQYMEAVKNILEGENNFEAIYKESETIKTLELINSIYYVYESKTYPLLVVH